MHIQYTQQKGLALTAITRPKERLVVLTITIKIPDIHSADNDAIRHVYAEALLAGCGTRSREQFLDALTLLGSSIAVTVEDNNINISLSTIDTTLVKTLSIFVDMLEKPTFKDSETNRIKEHLLNTLTLSKENAKNRAYQGFMSLLTHTSDPRHPFEIDETIVSVKKVKRSDLKKIHTSLCARAWIATSGGSSASNKLILKALYKLRSHYLFNEPGSNPTKTKIPAQIKKRYIQLINIPNKQNIEFSIGNMLPLTRINPDFSALFFGMSVLALQGGFSGRLMSTVREKEGLTYSIYGALEKMTRSEVGFWRISTFFNPKDTVRGITSTLREIQNICKKGITRDELRRFKSILKTRYTLIEDSLIRKIRELHTLTVAGITKKEYEIFKSEIQSMTIKQVNSALKKYLDPKKVVISGAGPVESIRKELTKFIN